MNYYNQNMINQLMRQKDNIDNMINQYSQAQSQPQVPVQNIINTIPATDFEARILKEDENINNIFITKKTMFLDKKNKKVIVKEIDGKIDEEYEIILPLDEKDKKIQALESEIKELRGMIVNGTKSNNSNFNGTNAAKKSSNGTNDTASNK